MSDEPIVQPLEDRVAVEPDAAESERASGLIIPAQAQHVPMRGTVIAIGPGRYEYGGRVPMDVKVGDRVIYSQYGGTEIKGPDGKVAYLLLAARDVLAITKDDTVQVNLRHI